MTTQSKIEEKKFMVLEETAATRKYPFTRKTLDQIMDLRENAEARYFNKTGEEVVVPAPIIIADAIDLLHQQTFGE